MAPTRMIAGCMGPPIAAVGLSLVVRPRSFSAVAASLEGDVAVVYLVGVMLVAVGAAVVRAHNVWTLAPPLIVTVVGWLAIVAGALRLFFPRAIAERTVVFGHEPTLVAIVGAAAVVLGGYLTFLSFRIGATPPLQSKDSP